MRQPRCRWVSTGHGPDDPLFGGAYRSRCGADQRRVQRPQRGSLPVRRYRGHRKPSGGVGQIDGFAHVEFCVAAQCCHLESHLVFRAQDCKLAAMQFGCPLAAAIDDTHNELRVVVVQDSVSALVATRAGGDVVGKMAADYFTGSRFAPPLWAHAGLAPSKLDRTDPVAGLTFGCPSFLIWRTWAVLSGPSSASYWGNTLTAS